MVAAGSLLGTLLSEPMSYPVGKVNLLDVYPMDFEEFLGAVNPPLLKYLEETPSQEIIAIQHTKLIDQYHDYLIVGGLPECVASWAEEKNSGTVLQIQKELLSLYENDIAKHNKKVAAGLVLRIYDVKKNEHPLKAFEDFSSFKLFFLMWDWQNALHKLKTSRLCLILIFSSKESSQKIIVCSSFMQTSKTTSIIIHLLKITKWIFFCRMKCV